MSSNYAKTSDGVIITASAIRNSQLIYHSLFTLSELYCSFPGCNAPMLYVKGATKSYFRSVHLSDHSDFCPRGKNLPPIDTDEFPSNIAIQYFFHPELRKSTSPNGYNTGVSTAAVKRSPPLTLARFYTHLISCYPNSKICSLILDERTVSYARPERFYSIGAGYLMRKSFYSKPQSDKPGTIYLQVCHASDSERLELEIPESKLFWDVVNRVFSLNKVDHRCRAIVCSGQWSTRYDSLSVKSGVKVYRIQIAKKKNILIL